MTTSTPNILVVDDSPENVKLLSRLLAAHDHSVSQANEGTEALRMARDERPDLILLDVMMPGLSGYEVCAQLKADLMTRDIPVIFISALGETLDKVRAFSLGAVDYITRPFQPEEVWARIETHLTLRALRRQLEVQNAQLRQEIAERRWAEYALSRRAAELEARNQELDAFAHTVAHDLKGPLSNMIGYAGLLEAAPPTMGTAEASRAQQAIVNNGQRMHRIIDNLLLLAEIRHTEVGFVPVDMGQVIADTLDRLDSAINDCEARINQPLTWPDVQGYPAWLEEVWTNYLSNALKYGGRPPEIYLGWDNAYLPEGNGGGEGAIPAYRFWVRDNGNGLTSEEQARLFTPFTRLHQASIRGHGLGLSIVRRIVEKMEGEVGVESEPGDGSLFYFVLRRKEPLA